MSYVYLLHFDRPYPGGRHPQHYLGVARNVEARLREHTAGSSKSRLTRACKEKGIPVALARQWGFGRPGRAFDFERKVKAKKRSYARICPYCREGA